MPTAVTKFVLMCNFIIPSLGQELELRACYPYIKFCVKKPFTELYSGVYKVPNHNVVKRERGSNFIFPIILKLLGRILSGERGRRRFRERKSKLVWGRLSSSREFYTPLIILLPLPLEQIVCPPLRINVVIEYTV